MERALYGIFTLGEVSEISLTRSISDTAPTRVKIPYVRAFHEVISIFIITQVVHALIWSTSVLSLRYEAQK